MIMDEKLLQKIERIKVLEREIKELKEKQEALKAAYASKKPRTIEELIKEYGIKECNGG